MDRDSGFERFKAFYKTKPFWSGELLGLKQFYLSEFEFDHDAEKPLKELPNIPSGTVLGKRAEYYFKFCVDESKNYRCLLHNLQVFKGRLTLGELDYILENTISKRRYHIELVYKFYLYRPEKRELSVKSDQLAELSKYIGPNERDNFLRKVDRLKDHQLPMLYRKETKELLSKHSIDPKNLEQRVCFLAHIFIPCQLWNHKLTYINTACIAGYYMGYSAFAKAETDHTYYLPHKHAWKMDPYSLSKTYSHKSLLSEIKQLLRVRLAPMIWKKDQEGNFERFFIIEDDNMI